MEGGLPEWLLWELLPRLDIRTVLCCRSVSKTWYSLISSEFNRLFVNRIMILLLFHKGTEIWFPFNSKSQPSFQITATYPQFCYALSREGLATGLISGWMDGDKETFEVGNPITNQWRKWEDRFAPCPESGSGFVMDPVTRDYVVFYTDNPSEEQSHSVKYSSATREWSKIKKLPKEEDVYADLHASFNRETRMLTIKRPRAGEEVVKCHLDVNIGEDEDLRRQVIGNTIICAFLNARYLVAYDLDRKVWDTFQAKSNVPAFYVEALVPSLDKP